ncbi:hypothetical protein BDZ97DRAFT_814044 [Flammula alnicola]|nr:hypothetical protein BDZ97DRAFT_814044 [Flammula alnicola]
MPYINVDDTRHDMTQDANNSSPSHPKHVYSSPRFSAQKAQQHPCITQKTQRQKHPKKTHLWPRRTLLHQRSSRIIHRWWYLHLKLFCPFTFAISLRLVFRGLRSPSRVRGDESQAQAQTQSSNVVPLPILLKRAQPDLPESPGPSPTCGLAPTSPSPSRRQRLQRVGYRVPQARINREDTWEVEAR